MEDLTVVITRDEMGDFIFYGIKDGKIMTEDYDSFKRLKNHYPEFAKARAVFIDED